MPKRPPPDWAAANFVLPRKTIEGLTPLAKSVANRERTQRSEELHGFKRRYSKHDTFMLCLNYLLQEHGLSQFCVEEAEPLPGRVRRFAVTAD
jgi:hypothetical protein